MIGLNNVSVSLNGNNVLKKISAKIFKGDRCVILGANGSGKSTLLKVIAGLVEPFEGSLSYSFEEDYSTDIVKYEKVGILIETPSLYSYLTVLENLQNRALLLNCSLNGINPFLSLSGLSDHLTKKVSQLSLGNKQKLGLALSLLNNPSLILLDEPTSALDPENTRNFGKLICEVNEKMGTTIVLVTHDLEEAELIATRIFEVKNGQLVEKSLHSFFTSKKHKETISRMQELVDEGVDFSYIKGKIQTK